MTRSRVVGGWSSRRATTAFMAGVVASLALLAATGAPGAMVQFSALINGAQETPPNLSLSIWTGSFTMDTDANTLSINVTNTGPPLGSPEIAAHIHGFAGPGVPAGILFALPPGSPKIAVWNFTEPQQADIIAGLTYANVHSTMFPGGEVRGQILRVPSCGDGILDGGEQCDDGNTDNGDCCNSLCQFEAASSACSAEAGLCGNGQCDGAGTCVVAPRNGCRQALKSILLLKDDATDDTKDKLLWKWIKGDATTQGDFGVPTGTTSYALCIYAGTANSLISNPAIPSSGTLWQPISDKGYKFKDPNGTPDGIQKVILKGGAQNKAKALAKGKGGNLPDPTLGNLPLPVTAQLVNSANNICFEGVYQSGDVIKNDASQFKAKAQ